MDGDGLAIAIRAVIADRDATRARVASAATAARAFLPETVAMAMDAAYARIGA